MRKALSGGFVRSVRLERELVDSFASYPFSIPAIRDLDELELDKKVTFLVGDNGSGKSTLIEAIAVAAGFNPEGGRTHSPILMAYPDAWIYELSARGLQRVRYEETEHYRITRDFLVNRERFFKHLFADDES